MTPLIEQIRADQLAARKAKRTVAATLLTTLLGEATTVGKNNGNRAPTNEETIAVVQKFIKNNNEIMSCTDPESMAYHNADEESRFLAIYLPSQMSEEVLRGTIAKIGNELNLHSPKDMGSIMKALKDQYSGSYDGKVASTLVREYLNG